MKVQFAVVFLAAQSTLVGHSLCARAEPLKIQSSIQSFNSAAERVPSNHGYPINVDQNISNAFQASNDYRAFSWVNILLAYPGNIMDYKRTYDRNNTNAGVSELKDIGNFNAGAVAEALGIPAYLFDLGRDMIQVRQNFQYARAGRIAWTNVISRDDERGTRYVVAGRNYVRKLRQDLLSKKFLPVFQGDQSSKEEKVVDVENEVAGGTSINSSSRLPRIPHSPPFDPKDWYLDDQTDVCCDINWASEPIFPAGLQHSSPNISSVVPVIPLR